MAGPPPFLYSLRRRLEAALAEIDTMCDTVIDWEDIHRATGTPPPEYYHEVRDHLVLLQAIADGLERAIQSLAALPPEP